MKILENKKNLSNEKLKLENIELKRKLNLLKKYISQSSIFNKTLQVELFEKTEELQNSKGNIIDDGEEIL